MLKGYRTQLHDDKATNCAFLCPSGCTCIHLRRDTALHLIHIVTTNWTALHLRYISVRAVRCVVCILFRRHWRLSHTCVLLMECIQLVGVAVLFGLRRWAGCNRCVGALRVCSAASEQQEDCYTDKNEPTYDTADDAADCAARYSFLFSLLGPGQVRDYGSS